MSAAAAFIIFASMAEDDHNPDLFGDEARLRYRRSIVWATFCICCSLVPLVIAGLVFHSTWYDPSALGTIPPTPHNNDTMRDDSLERDEGLQRGIFSSISGKTKTTPPPSTTPAPSTWPPFEGPDGVPGFYGFHILCMLGGLAMALTAKMWRTQERERAQRNGEPLVM